MPLYLEIVTPEGVAWKNGGVDSVTVPTRAGEIQILPGHIPLLTIVEAGELAVEIGGKVENLAVDKGYARCMGDTVSVLTEAAIEVSKINEAEVEEAKARAIKALEEAKSRREVDPAEIERLEAVMRFAVAQQLARAKSRR